MWSNQMLYAAASIVSVAVWVISKKYDREADADVANPSADAVSENLDGDSSEVVKQAVDDVLTAATRPSISAADPSIFDGDRVSLNEQHSIAHGDSSIHGGDVPRNLEQVDDSEVKDPIIASVDLASPGTTAGAETLDPARPLASVPSKQEAVDPSLVEILSDFGEKLQARTAEKSWFTSTLSKAYSVDQSATQAENIDGRIFTAINSIIRSLQSLDKKSEDYASRIDGLKRRIQMYQNQSKPNRTPRAYVLDDLTAFAEYGLSLVYVQTKVDMLMQRLQQKQSRVAPADWEAIKRQLSEINTRIDQVSERQDNETIVQVDAAFNAFKQGMDKVNQQIDQYLQVNLFASSADKVVKNIAGKVNVIDDACLQLSNVISKPVLTSGDPLANRRLPTSLDRFLSIETGMQDRTIHIGPRKTDTNILSKLLSAEDVNLLKTIMNQQLGVGGSVEFLTSYRAMCSMLAQTQIILKSSGAQPITITDVFSKAVQGRARVLYQQFNDDANREVSDAAHEEVHQDFQKAIAILTDDIKALCDNLDVLQSTVATTEAQVKALEAVQHVFHQWQLDAGRVLANQPLSDPSNNPVGQAGPKNSDDGEGSRPFGMHH